MDKTTRRDLLAGLAAVPAILGGKLLGMFVASTRPAEAAADIPGAAAPGRLRINPPSESVTRRG